VKRSTDRILVSHTGNLSRPPDVQALVDDTSGAVERRLPSAISEVVERQIAAGLELGEVRAARLRDVDGAIAAPFPRSGSGAGTDGSARGRDTWNDAPPPSRSSTHARPPCISANLDTSESPIPTPGE
jgi:hypothetical protein